MNVNDLSESKYLTKREIGTGILVTVTGQPSAKNMAKDNDPPDNKLIIQFAEQEKPFVCNVTNAKVIGAILGDDESDSWAGKRIRNGHSANRCGSI